MQIKLKYSLLITFLPSLLGLLALNSSAAVFDEQGLSDIAANVAPAIEHCEEAIETGEFLETFECGDELFETRFNALDGAGMNVGNGERFTGVPRADLPNWRNVLPRRETGPNAEACNVCHTTETEGGGGDAAGPAGLNVIRDPFGSASLNGFIQRNTPHLFGMAGPQLLAEEMNADMLAIVSNTRIRACVTGSTRTADLTTKGINFGSVTVTPRVFFCLQRAIVSINAQGVRPDLIVRPFQWKGNEPTVRTFSRGAFHNELGMSPVETAGDNVDNDFDGIANEITVADTTAMAIYLAGQPRPTSMTELDTLRDQMVAQFGAAGAAEADELGLPDLSAAEVAQINRGEQTFNVIGCGDCHRASLTVNNVVFNEPSLNPNYRESVFPAGQNAAARGLDPNNPISFDITQDQPDNIIEVNGNFVKHLGAFETDNNGGAVVRLYGDLKLHDMGPALTESVDEAGTGASVWITKELWGLRNTAPYLHDGRATTVEEAILEHGGEANNSRNNFSSLNDDDQNDVLAFLNNLVLFFPAEED